MKNIKHILLTAFLLETLCVTYALYVPALIPLASVLYTITGIAIAYALLFIKPAAVKNQDPVFNFKIIANRYPLAAHGHRVIGDLPFRFAMDGR
jgi:hypothetical protein